MSRLVLILAILIVVGGALSFSESTAAKEIKVQQNIYSLTCNIDLVYDGVTETYLVTPEECDRPPEPEQPIQPDIPVNTQTPSTDTPYVPMQLSDIPTDRLPNGGLIRPEAVPVITIQGTGDTAHAESPVEASVATAIAAVGVFVIVHIALLHFNIFEYLGRLLRSLLSKP